MATLLNTGLNRQALTALVQLVELGINPHALAHVVREMQREAQAMQQVEPPPFNLDDEPPNEPTPPGLFNSLCARMCCARGARAPS